MKTVLVHRYNQNPNQTSGSCVVLDQDNFPLFSSLTLERGWMNNQNNTSCYGVGEYELVLEYSNKFKTKLWEVKGVHNRSECKFHAANFWRQLNGCTSLGLDYTDLDNDGYKDVTASASTMKRFHKALEGETKVKLIVTGGPGIF